MIGKNEFKKSLFFFFLIALCCPTKTSSFSFIIPPLFLAFVKLGSAGITVITRHLNAKNFVSFQKDIAFYSVTIKTKYRKKTESIITYTATSPEGVIDQTMTLVKAQDTTHWLSIKPKVSLMTGETYFLGIITKDKKPRKLDSNKVLENRLEKKLHERLIVPICPNPTYIEKIISYIPFISLNFLR